MAIRRETLGCITPRSICETALGEMPRDFASARAEIPRACRRSRMRAPTDADGSVVVVPAGGEPVVAAS